MAIFDDLTAEQDRLEAALAGLTEAQWASPSAAAGWTVTDTVLHLAQTEEAVLATVAGPARCREAVPAPPSTTPWSASSRPSAPPHRWCSSAGGTPATPR